MGRFRIVSDLHLDLRNDADRVAAALAANQPHADCLVLAGDVAESRWKGLRPFLNDMQAAYQHLVYVPGNHEYYHSVMERTEALLRTMPGYMNCHERVINGVRVVGCTLWADMDIARARPMCYNDFFSISTQPLAGDPAEAWTPRHMRAMHQLHTGWLRKMLQRGPALVVTHHAPVMGDSSPAAYRNSPGETFFASSVGDELGGLTLGWAFGHTHHAATLVRDGYTLWTNALGYAGEHTGYADLVVDVAPHS